MKILLVDDDPQALQSTQKILLLAGHEVVSATDGQEALEKVRSETPSFDLVVTDVRMPKMGGLEFLRALSICGENLPVVLMTAYGTVTEAVWAMKFGAVDFLTKPFKRHALLNAVKNARSKALARKEDQPGQTEPFGQSAVMKEVIRQARKVAGSSSTVLIQGESGCGKEMIARFIHRSSERASGPFVAINCAAIPDQLLESELFGHEKGAFSGAQSAKRGLFETAHGGTLLFDEVGDMPLSVQAKLLRLLQEGEFRRVGSNVSRKCDVRVLSATHRDLKTMVQAGQFRSDLYFRLDVVSIRIPPLRERKDDIAILAGNFLMEARKRHGLEVVGFDSNVLDQFARYHWPGNVRELNNVVERAAVLCDRDRIGLQDLPRHLQLQEGEADFDESIHIPLGTPLKEVESLMIQKTLRATGGDKSMAAKILGVNSRTIHRKTNGK